MQQTGDLGGAGRNIASAVQHSFIQPELKSNAMQDTIVSGLSNLLQKVGGSMQEQAVEDAFIRGQVAAHTQDAEALSTENPLTKPFMQGGYNYGTYRAAQAAMQNNVRAAVDSGRYKDRPEEFQKYLAEERAGLYKQMPNLPARVRSEAVLSQMQLEGDLSTYQAEQQTKMNMHVAGQALTAQIQASLIDAPKSMQVADGADITGTVVRLQQVLELGEHNPIMQSALRTRAIELLYEQDYTEIADELLKQYDATAAFSQEERIKLGGAQSSSRKRTAVYRQVKAMELLHELDENVRNGNPIPHGGIPDVLRRLNQLGYTPSTEEMLKYSRHLAQGSEDTSNLMANAHAAGPEYVDASGYNRVEAANKWARREIQLHADNPEQYVQSIVRDTQKRGIVPDIFVDKLTTSAQAILNTTAENTDTAAVQARVFGAFVDHVHELQRDNPTLAAQYLARLPNEVADLYRGGLQSKGATLEDTIANAKAFAETANVTGQVLSAATAPSAEVAKAVRNWTRGKWTMVLNAWGERKIRTDSPAEHHFTLAVEDTYRILQADRSNANRPPAELVEMAIKQTSEKTLTLPSASEEYPVSVIFQNVGSLQDSNFYKRMTQVRDAEGTLLLPNVTTEQLHEAFTHFVKRDNSALRTAVTIDYAGNVVLDKINTSNPDDSAELRIQPEEMAEWLYEQMQGRSRYVTDALQGVALKHNVAGLGSVGVSGKNTAGIAPEYAYRLSRDFMHGALRTAESTGGITLPSQKSTVKPTNMNIAKYAISIDNTLTAANNYLHDAGFNNDNYSSGLAAARLVEGIALELNDAAAEHLRAGDIDKAVQALEWSPEAKRAFTKHANPVWWNAWKQNR